MTAAGHNMNHSAISGTGSGERRVTVGEAVPPAAAVQAAPGELYLGCPGQPCIAKSGWGTHEGAARASPRTPGAGTAAHGTGAGRFTTREGAVSTCLHPQVRALTRPKAHALSSARFSPLAPVTCPQ
jgi:hypothetical protein